MKQRNIHIAVIIALIGIIVYDRVMIAQTKKELTEAQINHHTSLFEFHNAYTSQMNSLKHYLHEINNDDYVGIREIYNTDTSADQKLNSVRGYINSRNKRAEAIKKETAKYIEYTKRKFGLFEIPGVSTTTNLDQMYSRIIKKSDKGVWVLVNPEVKEFEVNNITKHKK